MSKAYLFFFFTLGGVKSFFSEQRECYVLKPAASPEQFANTLVVCFTFLEQIQDFKNINWMNVIQRTSGLFAHPGALFSLPLPQHVDSGHRSQSSLTSLSGQQGS